MSDVITVKHKEINLVEINGKELITIIDDKVELITVGVQGPPGAPGEPGQPGQPSESTILVRSGELIPAHRVVFVKQVDLPVPLTDARVLKDIPQHKYFANRAIGISITSASAPDFVSVRTFGPLSDISLNYLTPGAVYCNPEGMLTNSISDGTFILQVGIVLDYNGNLFINIKQPILLED